MSNENKITVLGKTFNLEDERREYFRTELRKKLPELKLMEGFPIGEDDDIIKLSDPPYYTACPNPWLNDFIDQWEKEKKQLEKNGKRAVDFEVGEPYAADVSEGKYNPFYKFHPYPTKIPHKAISKYIGHYTQEGDIILDGFAGTGMTGLSAQSNHFGFKNDLIFKGKRNIILSDLSPIASFISYNYNTPTDRLFFLNSSKQILANIWKEIKWMYQTKHAGNTYGTINYVLWSDVFLCSNCNNELIFWQDGVDIERGKVKEKITCSGCRTESNKGDLTRANHSYFDNILDEPRKIAKQVPVLINYKVGTKRYEKVPDNEDLETLSKIENYIINEWVPNERMPEGGETRRNDPLGITHIYDFYSKRNLIALAKIKEALKTNKQNILITKVAYQITKLYRYTYMSGSWGAGGGPLSGTLYIPSLVKELNIISQIESAIKQSSELDTIKNYGYYSGNTGSTTNLGNLNSNSIDYIFTDPPFGANLNYSELAVFWESWLKVKTQNEFEAIQNKAQNKSLSTYKDLISLCFKEYFRVLKDGRWMTVVFSNTKAEVWNSINTAIQNAGFVVANVASLDKKKGSFKAVTSPTAVNQDLVISCYKPSSEFDQKFKQHQNTDVAVWDFVEEHLNHLPIHLVKDNATTAIIERSPKILFDRLIAFYVQKGLPVPIDAGVFQKGLRERFIERDGMFFTNEQVQEYDKKKAENPEFIQLSILVSSEQDGVLWLKNLLSDKSLAYQDIQPLWMQALAGVRKGDIIPELADILEDNFLKDPNGKWYVANPENEVDLEKLRNKRLLKQFDTYKEEAAKPKGKIKEARVEALRVGFKQCYQDKDFKTIVQIGDRIPNNLLMEDEVLLQFYDIAISRV
jgi:DNA modification methylase